MFPGCQEHDCGNDTAHSPVSVYDQGIQAECMEILLREHSGCKLDIPVMDSDITELHVCPDCAREDIAAYERPYLHTVHHLPGVRMCPKSSPGTDACTDRTGRLGTRT